MLTKLRLSNFKSIEHEKPININKITFLCGANSGGKSTVIQSILMMVQSMSSRINGDSVSLNGDLIQLGSFADIKNYKSKDNDISVGFSMDISPDCNVKVDFKFGVVGGLDMTKVFHPTLLESSINLISPENNNLIFKIKRNHDYQTTNTHGSSYLSNGYSVVEISKGLRVELEKEYPFNSIIDCETRGFLPDAIDIKYDTTRVRCFYIINALTDNLKSIAKLKVKELDSVVLPYQLFEVIREKIFEDLNAFKEDLRVSLREEITHRGDDFYDKIIDQIAENRSLVPTDIPDTFLTKNILMSEWQEYYNSRSEDRRKYLAALIQRNNKALQEVLYNLSDKVELTKKITLEKVHSAVGKLENFFGSKVKYLGPLRSEPKSIYPSQGMRSLYDVGLKGQFSAAVFHIHKARLINYPTSKLFNSSHAIGFDKIEASIDTLANACREWLGYIGVAYDIQTEDKGKHGYELSTKTSDTDEWQDLTHVGVGVSQILPIILMCLLADKGDVLLFEQPELHLHPKIQSRLTDFFIATSLLGRQCIIETHSEYMINRLRLRIAGEPSDNIKKSSTIHFVNKIEGQSEFNEVSISRFGAFDDWPDDFFDQSQKELDSILISGIKKKKREKGGEQ